MLYKEWLTVRIKVLMLAAIYTLIGVFVYITQPTVVNNCCTVPMLRHWFNYSFLVTMGAAILCGVEIFADEKSSGTLGFLLTRPITRRRIFMTKILLNLCALAVVFLVSSAVLFIINSIPRSITLEQYQFIDGVITTDPPVQIFADTVGFEEALARTLSTLMEGLCFVCISGIISLFARSLLESLTFNILAGIIFGLVVNSMHVPFYFVANSQNELFIFLGLAVLAVGVFAAGLFIFQRKEF